MTVITEYEVLLPYAEQYYMSHNCPNREAWAAALKSFRTQAGDCIRAVLVRYAAWISSSSSCERTFARTKQLRGGQSEDGFFVREEDIVQLQVDPLPGRHAGDPVSQGVPSLGQQLRHTPCHGYAANSHGSWCEEEAGSYACFKIVQWVASLG